MAISVITLVVFFQAMLFVVSSNEITTDKNVYNVFYWDIPPFIGKNKETGEIQGVIPDILNDIKPRCVDTSNQIEINLVNYTELASDHELVEKMMNKTKQSLAGSLWGPFLTHSISSDDVTSFCAKNGIVPKKLVEMNGMAVVVPQEQLAIINKVLSGLMQLFSMYTLFLSTCIIAGLFFWLIDRSQVEELSFIEGIISSIWWSFITMTTVGYGDIIPKTKAGRLFAIIWMYYAMIVFCIVTGIVTTLVFDDSLFDISNQNIAVMNHSLEEEIGRATYDINSFEFNTYDDVLAAVKNDNDIFAGLLPSYIAAWRQTEIQNMGLRVVAIHELTLYVFLLEMNDQTLTSLNTSSVIDELRNRCKRFSYEYIYNLSVKGKYDKHLKKTLYMIHAPGILVTLPHFYVTFIVLVLLGASCATYGLLQKKIKSAVSSR